MICSPCLRSRYAGIALGPNETQILAACDSCGARRPCWDRPAWRCTCENSFQPEENCPEHGGSNDDGFQMVRDGVWHAIRTSVARPDGGSLTSICGVTTTSFLLRTGAPITCRRCLSTLESQSGSLTRMVDLMPAPEVSDVLQQLDDWFYDTMGDLNSITQGVETWPELDQALNQVRAAMIAAEAVKERGEVEPEPEEVGPDVPRPTAWEHLNGVE